jgi:hypothetical protein
VSGDAPIERENLPVEDPDDEEAPKVAISRRGALLFGLFVASAVAFLYFVLPKLTGLKDTWSRLDNGDPTWLAAAATSCRRPPPPRTPPARDEPRIEPGGSRHD